MRTLALLLLCLTACAGTLPPPSGSCGVRAAGNIDDRLKDDGLKDSDVEDMVQRALDATTFTTDFRLNDQTENCKALQGFNVYTKPPGAFRTITSDGKNTWVLGYTICWQKLIVVAAPENKLWRRSALIHELIHAIQKCEAPRPTDEGGDPDHANWGRDNIFWSIDYEMGLP